MLMKSLCEFQGGQPYMPSRIPQIPKLTVGRYWDGARDAENFSLSVLFDAITGLIGDGRLEYLSLVACLCTARVLLGLTAKLRAGIVL